MGKVNAVKIHGSGICDKLDLKKDSKNCDRLFLTRHFCKVGNYYYDIARNKDNRIVEANPIRKSIGAENSFAENWCDRITKND